MDEKGLWELFYATGSPAVWLAIRQEGQAADKKGEEQTAPAAVQSRT